MFTAYIGSIFLYNSEIWTVTTTIESVIDSFQRRMLRNALNIRWPEIIRTSDLYDRTGQTPWSRVIRTRRLRVMGHILKPQEETSVSEALEEYARPTKKPRGG